MGRHVFSHWEVDGVNVGSDNPASIGPVTSDITIVAVYSPLIHTATIDSSPSGVQFVQPPQRAPFTVDVEDGENVTVQVPPDVEA